MAPFLAARARCPLIARPPAPRKTPCLLPVMTLIRAAPHPLLCPPSLLQTQIRVPPATLPPHHPLPLRTPRRRTLRLLPTCPAEMILTMAMGTGARARAPAPRPAARQAWAPEPSCRRRPRINHPARHPTSPLLRRRRRRRRMARLGTTTATNTVITLSNSSSRTMVTRMRAIAPEVRRLRRSGLQRRGPGTPEGQCAAATTRGARGTTRTCSFDSPFFPHIVSSPSA